MSGIVFARKQICRKLLIPSIISIKDIREYAPVHFLYLFVRMFFEVSFGYLDRGMSHGIADELLLIAPEIGNGSPTVPRYIECKNKTQEKCNYFTIYQCISGFYKKNVELHLLLILAIDSLIYSFYVTILLCKKAPVFD